MCPKGVSEESPPEAATLRAQSSSTAYGLPRCQMNKCPPMTGWSVGWQMLTLRSGTPAALKRSHSPSRSFVSGVPCRPCEMIHCVSANVSSGFMSFAASSRSTAIHRRGRRFSRHSAPTPISGIPRPPQSNRLNDSAAGCPRRAAPLMPASGCDSRFCSSIDGSANSRCKRLSSTAGAHQGGTASGARRPDLPGGRQVKVAGVDGPILKVEAAD